MDHRSEDVRPEDEDAGPDALTPDDVDNVRMFLWKTSVEAQGAAAAGASTARNVAGEG